MVYRGKPSAACEECRKRRNRCDLTAPSCGQCIKAKRQCNYRNTVDLLFFDESSKVVEKTIRTKGSAHQEPQDHLPENRLIVPRREHLVRLTEVVFYQPADDIALNFFMANYVGNDRINSQFHYMPSLYNRYGFSQPVIREAINAVGMAGYIKAARRPELMKSATKSYISAIKEVNLALSKPSLAGQDTTLAAVILLAMFEVMVMSRNNGLKNLTKHLNGALSVAALHLNRRQHTEFGVLLLKSVCQGVMLNCWIQGLPVPDGLLPVKNYLSRISDPSDLHTRYLDIVVELIHFRHAEGHQSPWTRISEATAIDTRLKDFAESLPEDGLFVSVHDSPEDELTYHGYFHIYPKNFTAHFWNNMRSSRMQLNGAIITQSRLLLSSVPGRKAMLEAMIQGSKEIIREMALEVCATVPQLAGYLDTIQSRSHSGPSHIPDYDADNLSEEGVTDPGGQQSTLGPPSPYILDPGATLRPSGSQSPQPAASTGQESRKPFELSSIPRPASQYHLLFQLHRLAKNEYISTDMRSWLQGRIESIQKLADPDDLKLMQNMVSAPSGAFPFFVTR